MLNLRKRPVVETDNDTPTAGATANLIAGAVRAIEGRLADGEDCEAVRHRLRQLQDTSATGDFRALALTAAETVAAMVEHMSVLGKALSDAEGRASRFQRMLDGMPVNVITCDAGDFKIDYVNHATVATLRGIEHLLPVKADHLVGQSIDIFHAHPEHQRRILRDPRKLPHHARIRLGEETLDLTVSGIEGAGGAHAGMMLTWSVVTEKVKTDAENLLLRQMVENMPINVMACDPKTFQITYANKATINTLRRIENLLPVKVDELVGQSVDIFHKNPEHQRRLLGNPRNLPHRAKIRVGPETLDLRVEAITDTAGNYLSAMLSWAIVTQQVTLADTFETRVKAVAQAVSTAATEMQTTAQSLAAAAEQTTRQSQTVASAAQQTALNTQSVASASEELTASVTEISRQVAESTRVAAEAAAHAEQTNEIVDSLAEAAKQIDSIVSLIKDIAGQTNLLALNATIEAARAGEAGKGFAVVAGEVKSLAKQTATATEDIARRVGEIQSKTHSAVDAIGAIAKVIGRISEISGSIAAAVEEQSASTNEISSNVQIVAGSTREVSSNIVGVTQAAGETGQSSSALLGAAGELAQQSEMLSTEVDRFLEEMRKL